MAGTDFVTDQQIADLWAAIAGRVNTNADARPLRDRRCAYWTAVGGGSTSTTSLAFALASAGTATADSSFGYGSKYASIGKVLYRVTTAATTAIAYVRGNNFCARGAADRYSSGFRVTLRGGPDTGTTNATGRFFMGLKPAANPTDVEPSSLANIIGLGWDSADANLQIMHNDASGAATKEDLGASWPVPTTNSAAMYRLDLSCDPGGSSVAYTVTDMVSGATTSGTLTTDLPATTTALAAHMWHSVGGTSSVVGLAAMDMYLETS